MKWLKVASFQCPAGAYVMIIPDVNANIVTNEVRECRIFFSFILYPFAVIP